MDYGKQHIFEFNLDTMCTHPSILIIGKRGSGKKTLIRDLMYHFKNIPVGAVISPPAKINKYYSGYFPDVCVHYETDDNIFKKILGRQCLMINRAKEYKKQDIIVDPSALLVMDQCMHRGKHWTDTAIETIMNGRHYNLTYILTIQSPSGITPDLGSNFDYIFLCGDDSSINRKIIWDNYAPIFPKFDIFKQIFDMCTRDHRVMVIDNSRPFNSIQDKIFWFKASDRKFNFGSNHFQNIGNIMRGNFNDVKSDTPTDINISAGIDYLFEYFVNENTLCELKNESCKSTNDSCKSANDLCKSADDLCKPANDRIDNHPGDIDINDSSDIELISKKSGTLQISYQDENYKLSTTITNLNNDKLFKILCKHIKKNEKKFK